MLRKPDILLETNAQGQSNWTFGPAGAPGATPSPSAPPAPSPPSGKAAAAPPPNIALSSLTIEGGTLAMRDAAGRTTTLALKQLTATAAGQSGPLHLTMDATYNGAPVSLTADTGPLAGLMGAAPRPGRSSSPPPLLARK